MSYVVVLRCQLHIQFFPLKTQWVALVGRLSEHIWIEFFVTPPVNFYPFVIAQIFWNE